MKNKFKILALVLISILSVVSCKQQVLEETKEESAVSLEGYTELADQLSQIKKDIDQLKEENQSLSHQLVNLKETNSMLKEKIEKLIDYEPVIDDMENHFTYLDKKILRSMILVDKLPSVQKVLGRINVIRGGGQHQLIYVDPVEWLSDDEAVKAIQADKNVSKEEADGYMPNGFYIRDFGNENVAYIMSSECMVSVIDLNLYPYMEKWIGLGDLASEIEKQEAEEFKDIYNFYVIDGKVVLIEELYIP